MHVVNASDSFGALESDLVEAGVYATMAEADEHGLVMLAAGHAYWVDENAGQFRLLVEPPAMTAARHHLAAYDRERLTWPPPPIVDPWRPGKGDRLTPLLWCASVLILFNVSHNSPAWFDRGALDSQAVFGGGEWWRIFTALFLHADAGHVISNALSGILVFSATLSTFGRLRGWALLLVASAIGNLAVAGINFPGPYSSVGASTAIFAGVGLLTGRAICVAWRSRHPHRWRAMFGPLAAGLTVLALHGAGGQRVDVGAHLTGFCAGLALGFVAGLLTARTWLRPSSP